MNVPEIMVLAGDLLHELPRILNSRLRPRDRRGMALQVASTGYSLADCLLYLETRAEGITPAKENT
jgi:hypothetical protein